MCLWSVSGKEKSGILRFPFDSTQGRESLDVARDHESIEWHVERAQNDSSRYHNLSGMKV
jgi:hypothetical protein